MIDLVQQTGIIGKDLPNIYIDSVSLQEEKAELNISYFQKQVSSKFLKNKSIKIYFRFFQILEKETFERLKQLSNIELLKLTEIKTLKILNVNFESSDVKDEKQPGDILKKSKIINFDIPKNIQNLYYLAIPYFYETDQKKLIESNTNLSIKKTEEIVLENNKSSKTTIQHATPKDNIMWYGDVVKVGNDFYTNSKEKIKLTTKQVENNKIKDYRLPVFDNNKDKKIESIPTPPLNNQFAKQNFTNFVEKSPVLMKEKTFITENVGIVIKNENPLNTAQMNPINVGVRPSEKTINIPVVENTLQELSKQIPKLAIPSSTIQSIAPPRTSSVPQLSKPTLNNQISIGIRRPDIPQLSSPIQTNVITNITRNINNIVRSGNITTDIQTLIPDRQNKIQTSLPSPNLRAAISNQLPAINSPIIKQPVRNKEILETQIPSNFVPTPRYEIEREQFIPQLLAPIKKSIKNELEVGIPTKNIKKGITIDFTINLKKLLIDNFLNKTYVNNSLFEFLKDSFIQKEIKLFKKLVPNKNKSINSINSKQRDILCTNKFTYNDSAIFKPDEYLRTYSMTDQIDYSDNKNKYKYHVEMTFENACGKLLLEELNYLNQGLKIIQEFYTVLVDYNEFNDISNSKRALSLARARKSTGSPIKTNVKSKYTTKNFSVLKEITDNFIKLYSIYYDLSSEQKGDFQSKIYNFILPETITSTSIKSFEKKYLELIKEYTDLYESITGTRNIISIGFKKYNVKNSIITIRKEISEEDLDSVQKNQITIRYIDDIIGGKISFENFIERIKQEKERLFSTEKNNVYQSEYLFSYLSPESYKIDNISYNIGLLQKELNQKSYELFLNNSIVEMKQVSKLNINKNKVPKFSNKVDEDQNKKIELYKRTSSLMSDKYGFKIQENFFKKSNIIEESTKQTDFYKQTKAINKAEKINKLIDFNKNFNVSIPANNVVTNIPNHMIKAREESTKLNTYKDIFDYRILVQVEFEVNNSWVLLTKSSLLNYISINATNMIKCRLIEHKYEYNKNLKYDVSSFCQKKLDTFTITYDRTSAERLIQTI